MQLSAARGGRWGGEGAGCCTADARLQGTRPAAPLPTPLPSQLSWGCPPSARPHMHSHKPTPPAPYHHHHSILTPLSPQLPPHSQLKSCPHLHTPRGPHHSLPGCPAGTLRSSATPASKPSTPATSHSSTPWASSATSCPTCSSAPQGCPAPMAAGASWNILARQVAAQEADRSPTRMRSHCTCNPCL